MRALASFVSGRRGKWVVLGIWIVVFAALMPLGAKLGDETQDDTTSFLPASAESTDVVKILDEDFASGETTQGLIVYQRDGGLTAADKQKIAADAKALEELPDEELPLTRPPIVPFAPNSPPDLVSQQGDLAYTVLTVPTDFEEQADWGENVRDLIGSESDGMRIILTGDLGFSVDSEEVFSELDTKLLLATVLLVLFLLGAIYRAVLVALTPLVVVFFAYTAATALVYLYAESGATVSSNGTTILVVLDVRGRHRLLPATGLALPRGAAPDRGQARCHGAGAAAHRADDPRQRPHGVAGDADPGARRRPAHLHPRPRGRDRRRLRDGRRPHTAPGAADDLRPPRLLAAGERRSLRPRARRGDPPGGLAPGRRPRPAAAGGRAGDHVRCLSSPDRSACSPTRSTTRPPRSSRSRSSRSRASSCSRRRSRPACCSRPRSSSRARTDRSRRARSMRSPAGSRRSTALRRRPRPPRTILPATSTCSSPTTARWRRSRSSSRATRSRRSAFNVVPEIRASGRRPRPGRHRTGRRRLGDPVRLRSGDRERPEADRADRAAW